MNKLDEFAMAALQGMLASASHSEPMYCERIAEDRVKNSYMHAELMAAESERRASAPMFSESKEKK